ncbi:N-acetylmuramoyl-L-alanine amidase family protein [Fictibacillus fluitans]|uniref:N-acetylmuramoyl-L-alanine amidase n=1 Tax=Fictibacillus fluitans TaxID=3058422 RepID=A0ABT8HYS1_9BACL|nr:N-acetylmuramoyl-L-alanine amidase [Fictibacillus sp. NE201]MDN4525893.1 N-acetylmuramoyl-L-alanine amidase [Fictibacillus sp. NE201]
MVKIFIDPGHGGSDSGATGNGLLEKNITLQIATRIKNILLTEYNGVEVRMSRTTDEFLSLKDRTDAANRWGADYLLSVHINAGGGTGFESYIYPGTEAPTTTYRNHIHDAVLELADFRDRGKKTANFHMLRESNMPAVLTENGFIDTVDDADKLKSASFIGSIARGHVNGLVKSFNLKRKPTAVYHTVIPGDTVYSLGKTYKSTINQMKKWNSLDKDFTIYIGQGLRVK